MNKSNPVMLYLQKHDLIDDFLSYAIYMRLTANLSLFNSAVLIAQRDGLGFATTEAIWRNRFGREIKPGANPLVILKNFGPLDLYFEACDTFSPDGYDLPEWVAVDLDHIPDYPQEDFYMNTGDIIRILNNHGVYYEEREKGGRLGGFMEYNCEPLTVKAYRNKKYEYIQTHYAMVVNQKLSPVEKGAVIFHEIGHLLCGHLPKDEELKKLSWLKLSIPKRDIKSLSTNQKEYEAETACMLIMNSLGFEYNRSKYLDQYRENGKEPVYDLGISVAAADQFLSWIH